MFRILINETHFKKIVGDLITSKINNIKKNVVDYPYMMDYFVPD